MENLENNLPSQGEETTPQEFEKINCQYCQDVGPCNFCTRGQAEAAELTKKKKGKKKDKWYL